MKQPKTCQLFELMTEVVLLWIKDNKLSPTTHQYGDLKKRLTEAKRQLDNKYVCKKASICIEK